MPAIDTALMVTQLIDMVVQGVAPKLRSKARKAILSKKRDILKKISGSRILLDKLETWYGRKSQVDADLIFRSAGFGGIFDKYVKEASEHQKDYDKSRSMLNMYEAKQQDALSKLDAGMNRLENGSPFMANKVGAEVINAASQVDNDASNTKGY